MATELQFTYNFDPAGSTRDETRYLVGDTDRRRPLVDDREITYALTRGGDPQQAAVIVLNSLANKFAREADTSVGDVSKSLGSVSDVFRQRAVDLQAEIATRALPFFGGRSISGKRALDQDTDATPQHFRVGQGDDPWAVQLDYAYTTLGALGYW